MKLIEAVNNKYVPAWGNKKKYIAVHYLGAVGDANALDSGGYGTQYYVHRDGVCYHACSDDAVTWQVGTAGYYKQLHPYATNYNVIGIEMCCYCDGNKSDAEDPKWYFSEATQKATVELVQYLMKKYSIPAENVLRHGDIVNKTCPAPYMHNNGYKGTWTWTDFMKRVRGEEVATPKQIPGNAINDIGLKYKAHCQTLGWCDEVHDGQTAGTVGFSKRLEALTISCPEGIKISAKAHIQSVGWKSYDAAQTLTIGTTGEGKRLEALELHAEGTDKVLHYQVQMQTVGWQSAVTDGYPVGSMGQGKRIESIKIWFTDK